jgi:futalosine hydrolase
MMNIIFVAATEMELELLRHVQWETPHRISIVCHGVGMMATTFHITELALQMPDLIIQIGVAGTFVKSLHIGEVVFVEKEQCGDMGAEDKEQFLDLAKMKLGNNTFPFIENYLPNPFPFLTSIKKVKGITVNTCSGHATTIQNRIQQYQADIETMEGAALHYVCLIKRIPFVQLRGISNFIEPRNRANWNINLAIKNCQHAAVEFVNSLPLNA